MTIRRANSQAAFSVFAGVNVLIVAAATDAWPWFDTVAALMAVASVGLAIWYRTTPILSIHDGKCVVREFPLKTAKSVPLTGNTRCLCYPSKHRVTFEFDDGEHLTAAAWLDEEGRQVLDVELAKFNVEFACKGPT